MVTCQDFAGTLPTLDYQCWLEGVKLLYKFFMKPRAKKTVIMMSSALGENVKIAALTQEVVRLSKNTSELVDIHPATLENKSWGTRNSRYDTCVFNSGSCSAAQLRRVAQ